jgi:hypothetical protein
MMMMMMMVTYMTTTCRVHQVVTDVLLPLLPLLLPLLLRRCSLCLLAPLKQQMKESPPLQLLRPLLLPLLQQPNQAEVEQTQPCPFDSCWNP